MRIIKNLPIELTANYQGVKQRHVVTQNVGFKILGEWLWRGRERERDIYIVVICEAEKVTKELGCMNVINGMKILMLEFGFRSWLLARVNKLAQILINLRIYYNDSFSSYGLNFILDVEFFELFGLKTIY